MMFCKSPTAPEPLSPSPLPPPSPPPSKASTNNVIFSSMRPINLMVAVTPSSPLPPATTLLFSFSSASLLVFLLPPLGFSITTLANFRAMASMDCLTSKFIFSTLSCSSRMIFNLRRASSPSLDNLSIMSWLKSVDPAPENLIVSNLRCISMRRSVNRSTSVRISTI